MTEAPSVELAKAARLRVRAVPQRLAGVTLAALALQLAFDWPLIWLWVGAYALAALVESEIGRRYAERIEGGGPGRGHAYVAAVAAVSLIYGGISLPLMILEHARDGEVYGVLLLATGLVNLLVVSRASWAAVLATAGPYGGYLLINPVLATLLGVDGFSWVGAFFGALLLAHTYAAWRRQRSTLRAEAAARREVEARSAQAEAATAAKSAFVAMISHELRTPLSGILAAGSQLKSPELSPQARAEAVEVVVDAGRFMHALLDDLLDLAKLEAGKMATERLDFDLGQLVWAIERHWAAAAREADRPLQLTSAMGLPLMVCGDPTRMRQILNNLLSNAVKFTGPAGVTWSVDVCRTDNDFALTVRVTDTGPGMAPEQLDRLFTAFEQTDASVARTHGGTGLGLALSRELARAMGGELRVESELGRGSTFVLSLPLAQASAAREEEAVAPLASSPAMKLLIVDDHPINRRTLTLLLQPSGAEVTAAETAAEALERLATEAFDVVLSDVNMPDMDGLTLTRTLRATPGPNQSTAVIAVTGSDGEDERAACRAAGMIACVPKPIDPRALYLALAEVMAAEAEADLPASEAA
jgi:signal transduction histidine kinase/ActR/RegA family two-component response regulator